MEYKKHVSNRIKDLYFKFNFIKTYISSLSTIYFLIFQNFNEILVFGFENALEQYSIKIIIDKNLKEYDVIRVAIIFILWSTLLLFLPFA